jgi:SAM-dependent methyltransferase
MYGVNFLNNLSIKDALPASIIEFLYFLKFRKPKLSTASIYQNLLKKKRGIEIGGPSMVFKTTLPVYHVLADLDSVNFSTTTIWEGSITEESAFNYYWNKTGKQYIAEATALINIKNDTYDFLLSSNCLEHIANPVKALKEWVRIIKPDGYLLLVLPRKEVGFDHKRPITSFEHILQDYKNKITEHDLTHLEEILALHDLSRDRRAGNYDSFKSRCLNNFQYRGLHHHVFDMSLIQNMFEHCNINLVQADVAKKNYYAIGQIKK